MNSEKTICLAGGCFWGCQKYFDLIPGVVKTTVGYANGHTPNPKYAQVKRHETGHAESVMISYQPHVLPLSALLQKYFAVIDPVSVNRQGEDEGDQYRTGIYWTDGEDRETVLSALRDLQTKYAQPLAVEAEPLRCFYEAEEEHQKYLEKHPDGYCHIHFD
ncbi:MAG: peptide-methionine (S)-S-oxide reductase MsrA [Clostridia bacterium]|nr:peptide-methionine (S)-S-oxide reductase MsrA [Clostridia bacterium]